jgi:hypothetical protein
VLVFLDAETVTRSKSAPAARVDDEPAQTTETKQTPRKRARNTEPTADEEEKQPES